MAAKLANLLRQCTAMAVILNVKPIDVLKSVRPLIQDSELAKQADEQLQGSNHEPRHRE